jgi:uncharacterized protein (TIGR03032 family)
VREQAGTLNTHFCSFMSPMGIAYQPRTGRLAIGTRHEVWSFRNQPDVAPKLEPKGACDAAFLPRMRHATGDIRIHEIAWSGAELWAVNTRFSCLCTFDGQHSFRAAVAPAIHLSTRAGGPLSPERNGHGRWAPKYVSCLGLTDTAGGWRVNKPTAVAYLM